MHALTRVLRDGLLLRQPRTRDGKYLAAFAWTLWFSGCVGYNTSVVLPTPTEVGVERRIQALSQIVGSGVPPQPCYSALARYRQYMVYRAEYRRHKTDRDQAERQVRSARWLGDQPGADEDFWRMVAEQNRGRADRALARERRAAESADSEKLQGDSNFQECQRLV